MSADDVTLQCMCLFIGHGSCIWPEGPLKLLSKKKKTQGRGVECMLTMNEAVMIKEKAGVYSHPLSMDLVARGAYMPAH